MRNALIVLGVVALVLVTLGAVNHGLLFDIDLVVVTWAAVSLFWVAVVVVGVVVLTGMVVAFFSRTGAVATRRKLEKELQVTYERLRSAEAKLPAPVPVPPVVVDVTPGEQTAVTGVVPAPRADDARTAVQAAPEAETDVISAAPEAETAVISATPEAETAAAAEDAAPAEEAAPPAEPAAAAEDAAPPAAS